MRARTLIPAAVFAVPAISLLIAACGSGSSTNAAVAPQTGALAYAQCMHSHGVPNFPDPDSSGAIPKDKIIALGDGPQFRAAESACLHVMPASGLGPEKAALPTRTRLADGLAFARCMRNHGFPTFPDPTAHGELTPQMVTAAGIDLHQRALLQAGIACAAVTHGLITRAAVERAVNGS
jgi:hypothetical protein